VQSALLHLYACFCPIAPEQSLSPSPLASVPRLHASIGDGNTAVTDAASDSNKADGLRLFVAVGVYEVVALVALLRIGGYDM